MRAGAVSPVTSGGSAAAAAWVNSVAAARSRRIPGIGPLTKIEEADSVNPSRVSNGLSARSARTVNDNKPLVEEFYVIDGKLSIPERIIYEGKGDKIYGFPREQIQRFDKALKELPDGTMLPSLLIINKENIDAQIDKIEALKDPGNALPAIDFRQQIIRSGMMIDRYS